MNIESIEDSNKRAGTASANSEYTNDTIIACRLDASRSSSCSSESDLSLCFNNDRDLDDVVNRIIVTDELPAFEIRLISPLGRTPSPIDNDVSTASDSSKYVLSERSAFNFAHNNSEYVALHDINAQISPPSDKEALSRINGLETIYEGIFLNTPTRKRKTKNDEDGSNLFEKSSSSRSRLSKENHMSVSAVHETVLSSTNSQAKCVRTEYIFEEKQIQIDHVHSSK